MESDRSGSEPSGDDDSELEDEDDDYEEDEGEEEALSAETTSSGTMPSSGNGPAAAANGTAGGSGGGTGSGPPPPPSSDEGLHELLGRLRKSRVLLEQRQRALDPPIGGTETLGWTEGAARPVFRVGALPGFTSSSSSAPQQQQHLAFPRPARWFTPLPPLFDDEEEDEESVGANREGCLGRAADRGSVTSLETEAEDAVVTALAGQPFEVWRIHAFVDRTIPRKRLCFRLWQAHQGHDGPPRGGRSESFAVDRRRFRRRRIGHRHAPPPVLDNKGRGEGLQVLTRDPEVVREWVRELRRAARKSGRRIVILVTSQDARAQKHPGFRAASDLVLDPGAYGAEDKIPEPTSRRTQVRGPWTPLRSTNKAPRSDKNNGAVILPASKKSHDASTADPSVVAKQRNRPVDGVLCWKRRTGRRPDSPDLFSATATVASC
jgi:hypothetical protein